MRSDFRTKFARPTETVRQWQRRRPARDIESGALAPKVGGLAPEFDDAERGRGGELLRNLLCGNQRHGVGEFEKSVTNRSAIAFGFIPCPATPPRSGPARRPVLPLGDDGRVDDGVSPTGCERTRPRPDAGGAFSAPGGFSVGVTRQYSALSVEFLRGNFRVCDPSTVDTRVEIGESDEIRS